MSRRTTIPPPTLAQVARLAEQAGYKLSQEELEEYREMMEESLQEYSRLHDLPEPKRPIKYPRDLDSIQKPHPSDNPYNAWSMRMDIKGAAIGKLSGKRIAVKDNVQIAGVPMTNGSEIIRGFVPTEDATVVTRVLDAGGQIVGTTNVTDMCISGASQFGLNGPVLNPHDKTRSTGGSSSGSGAVVALGEADMAFGCDQGGSIRIPASWCGIVGLKPTHGLVPYTGVVPIESTIDHIGPMTRTVADCALMLEVIAGYDGGLDHRQPRDLAVPPYSQNLTKKSLDGRKIGFVTEGFANCSEGVVQGIKDSLKYFRAAGITVEEVAIPWHKDGKAVWVPTVNEGATMVMMDGRAAEIGVKGHKSSALADHMHRTIQTKSDYLAKPFKALALTGRYVLETAGTAYYAKACNLLRTLTHAYDQQLETYDVLLMPTLPYVAPELITTVNPKPKESAALAFSMVQNTAPFNFTGHPFLTINAGFNKDKLPIGLGIIGKHFDEETVLAYAHAFEQQRDK